MIRTGDAPESRTLTFVVLALAYAAFVVYGSLLPFDFIESRINNCQRDEGEER
jgi:hypothetical protein